MTLQEYLKKCKAKDVDALTDKQVADYLADSEDCATRMSVDTAMNGVCVYKPTKEIQAKAYKLMRQSLKENKKFRCFYADGESCCGPIDYGFDMYLE